MNGAQIPRGAQILRAVLVLIRGLFTTVAGNVSLALLALALALSLWVYVTDKENPTQEQLLNGDIDVEFVNVPNGLAISQTSKSTVSIRIEAPKNDIDDLSQEDFEATIDLGGVERGTNAMTVVVASSNSDVNIVAISPARINSTSVLYAPEVALFDPDIALTIGAPRTDWAVSTPDTGWEVSAPW